MNQLIDTTQLSVDDHTYLRNFLSGLSQLVVELAVDNYGSDRSLKINNPKSFVEKLKALQNAINTSKRRVNWLQRRNIYSIWQEATAFDLLNSEDYLDGLIYTIKSSEELLESYQVDWYFLQNNTVLGKDIHSQLASPDGAYEAPLALDVAITDQGDEPKDINQIHRAYFRLISPTVAVLNSIQMPKLQFTTHYIAKTINDMADEISRVQSSLKSLVNGFPGIKRFFPPEMIASWETERTYHLDADSTQSEKLANSLQVILELALTVNYHLSALSNVKEQLPDRVFSKISYTYSAVCAEFAEISAQLDVVVPVLHTYFVRSKNQSVLNRPMRAKKGQPASQVATVFSTIVLISQLKNLGIKKLRIPLDYPLRPHINEQRAAYARAQRQDIAERTLMELGIPIEQVSAHDKESFYEIDIENIKVDRPLLTEFFGGKEA